MKNENVVNKIKGFPGRLLSGVSRLYSRLVNKETTSFYQQRISGRSRIKCGITPVFNNSAFTLIELLVVVLIIGILAAVALPQYTLAVNKARFANLRSLAKPYINAMEAYHMANGEWPDNFDELSVDAPAGLTVATTTNPPAQCAYNNDMYCCMKKASDGGWAVSVDCAKRDYSFGYVYILDAGGSLNNTPLCLAKTTDTNAIKLCNSLGGSKISEGGISSPEGSQSYYYYYSMQM